MDSFGVKFSGGKIPLRSDLRVRGTSRNSCGTKSKNGGDIRVGTWNVRSLYRSGAFQMMIREVGRYGTEIVALQETRWDGNGAVNSGAYTLHYGGSETHSFGVGFFINNKISSAIRNIRFVNERLGLLVVQGRWYKIAIINAYAPTEDKEDEIKDGFYDELEHIIDQLPSDYMKIVLGDFNAKIGKEEIFKPTIGLESLHDGSNENGNRVINFATGRNMIIKSTCFKHKNIHKQTWISSDGNTINQIDHVLVDRRRHTNILDVRSYRGADCDSDHFLVIAKIRERLSTRKNKEQAAGIKRINVRNLAEEDNGVKYAVEVVNRFEALEEVDETEDNAVNKQWENVRDVVIKSAESTIGYCRRSKNKSWFDSECENMIKERTKARLRWLSDKSDTNKEVYNKSSKSARDLVRSKKRHYLKRKVEEIDENC
ncbi:craniofacial development protein 2-like [Ooceraea biroi]|uniref:craniofacial development protein 2-like n=1 Tax=Ooceraea biroi TaxID=2015173 RepID=UPI000F086AB5|nr:craniofacial development protein 2-like [Ooceraea biroi]